jgi:hypothetical protein
MNQTFRLQKTVKYQGMAFTAVFLAAILGYTSIFFIKEPAKHGFKGPHSVAFVGWMGIVVFGTMTLASIYMWAAYYVERLSINGTTLSIRSILQKRQFEISELQCLKWRIHPFGGSILFRMLGSKTRLDLRGFGIDDRLRIIRALHDLVPSHVQEGWPLFCHKVALPLRDGKPSIVRADPSAGYFTITRKRYDRMLSVALPLSVVLAVFLWASLKLWQFTALPLLVIAAWLLLRFDVPAEGKSEVRLTSTSQGRGQLIGMGAVVLSLLLMIGLALVGVGKSIACGVTLVVLLLAFPPMLFLFHKADKQRRIADERAAEPASLEWELGEAGSVIRAT